MVELYCIRCGHVWTYNGLKKLVKNVDIYVSCPNCRNNVLLSSRPKK